MFGKSLPKTIMLANATIRRISLDSGKRIATKLSAFRLCIMGQMGNIQSFSVGPVDVETQIEGGNHIDHERPKIPKLLVKAKSKSVVPTVGTPTTDARGIPILF